MMYDPVFGSVVPPTQEEVMAHSGSWWVQVGYESNYQNFHFRNPAEVLQFIKQCELSSTIVWRPYYQETGILAEWPVPDPKKVMARVDAPHDGTGSV